MAKSNDKVYRSIRGPHGVGKVLGPLFSLAPAPLIEESPNPKPATILWITDNTLLLTCMCRLQG